MNRIDQELWISRGKTAALILGLPALLVFGELLRGYFSLGSGGFLPWAARDLAEFTGAYAYLAIAVALTTALVGFAVKRASRRAIGRARQRGLAIGRRQGRLEAKELRQRGRVQVANPGAALGALEERAARRA
jgi:hypothetical protein